MSLIYLKKASDEVISHCRCDDGRISFPPQMDCPWCGCGWLFTCITCRAPFTFAEGVELPGTWEDLAKETKPGADDDESLRESRNSWMETMQIILKGVQIGRRYAIVDGWVFPIEQRNIRFEGFHARHEFPILPQVLAIADKAALDLELGNRSYWEERALPAEA